MKSKMTFPSGRITCQSRTRERPICRMCGPRRPDRSAGVVWADCGDARCRQGAKKSGQKKTPHRGVSGVFSHWRSGVTRAGHRQRLAAEVGIQSRKATAPSRRSALLINAIPRS